MRTLWNTRTRSTLAAVGLLTLLAGGALGAEPSPPAFKTVPFDQAMKDQVERSLPLQLAFPAEYEMASDSAIDGVLWARPADLEVMLRTRQVPAGAGFFRGRMLGTSVRYDPASGRFNCGPGCGEAELVADHERRGGPIVAWRKHEIGVPLLLVEGRAEGPALAGPGKYYMAYIATLIGDTVMQIAYVSPAGSADEGAAAWQAFRTALVVSAAVAQVAPTSPMVPLDFFDMAARGSTFRPTADVFIAAVRGGDVGTALELIGPAVIEHPGRGPVETYLTTTVLPFFARFAEFGSRITIAPTRDGHGSSGVAFHLTTATKDGGERPFSIFVVDVDGRQVVADVVVDRDLSTEVH